MKYQLKSFQMSLVLHAFIITLLVVMHNTLPHGANLIVIDFTAEDSAKSALLIDNPVRTVNPLAHKQQAGKHEEAEIAQQKPDIAKSRVEPLPPVQQEKQQATTADGRVPLSAQSRKVPESGKNYQNDNANQNALPVSNNTPAPLKATVGNNKNTFTGTGENTENMLGAGVPGYLKANFSYIKDIISRHIAYPKIARQLGWAGKVKLSFIVTVSGDARNIQVIESSGKEILDHNAIEAIRNSSPFPRPPVEAKIIIPVLYTLH
jgi:periplasmic protein TonB